MLFATLPGVHEVEGLENIISHPSVDAVRYNTGQISPYSAQETLERLAALCDEHEKQLWIDLKGRQLRITHWAYPRDGGRISLNHNLKLKQPAWIQFRGDARSRIREVQGNIIWVDPPPRHAVGEGQAVNIISDQLEVDGYLTDSDKRYLDAASVVGKNRFMLSFVERESDIDQVQSEFGPAHELILKIESGAGVDFASRSRDHRLMAARDDLMLQIGPSEMLPALETIIGQDPEAVCASRLFSSLEQGERLSMADVSDLELMRRLGYRHFMLSDTICRYHFSAAITAWEQLTF